MLCSERFDHLVQAALVPRSLILVDNTLVYHRIDYRYGGAIGCRRRLLVAFLDGLDHVLDMGAHLGAKPHLVKAGFFRLTGAFPC